MTIDSLPLTDNFSFEIIYMEQCKGFLRVVQHINQFNLMENNEIFNAYKKMTVDAQSMF